MNRSMRNVVLLGLILLLGGLIGAGVTFGQGDRESLLQFGTEEVRLSEEVPADGISRLRAEAGSMDIELAAGASDDKIVATITGRASKKSLDKIKLELDPQGDELTVKGKEGGENRTKARRPLRLETEGLPNQHLKKSNLTPEVPALLQPLHERIIQI